MPSRRSALAAVAVAVLNATVLAGCGATPSAASCTVVADGRTVRLDPSQAQDAAVIAAVGHRLGMPDHAVTVAVATALQESHLHDLTHGDRDSVGLFQQRPSQGWGTRAQLLDPAYAAAAFYSRLKTVDGWQTLPVTDAAQAVQISAAPAAYAQWEGDGRAVAVALTGEAPRTLACHAGAFEGATPAGAALPAAAAGEYGAPVLGVPIDTKTGWGVAAWAVAHAAAYHVPWVAYAGATWTMRSGRWVDRPPPGGATAPGAVVVGPAQAAP